MGLYHKHINKLIDRGAFKSFLVKAEIDYPLLLLRWKNTRKVVSEFGFK